MPQLAGYREIEKAVMWAIKEKFHLPASNSTIVKAADTIMLFVEAQQLTPWADWANVSLETAAAPYLAPHQPVPAWAKTLVLKKLTPEAAENAFLDRYSEIVLLGNREAACR
jgi:hypothetical protein